MSLWLHPRPPEKFGAVFGSAIAAEEVRERGVAYREVNRRFSPRPRGG